MLSPLRWSPSSRLKVPLKRASPPDPLPIRPSLWARVRALLARTPPPPPSQAVSIPGLSGKVLICRDRHGIPRIYAERLRDLCFGLGYAVAEDRLFQMDLFRRIALGRLSEILGEVSSGVRGASSPLRSLSLPELDLFWRALRLERVAKDELRLLSEEAMEALEGFRDGVNAWIEASLARRLPLEFALLGYYPEPWRAEDSLAIGRFISWLLSLAFQADLALSLFAEDPALQPLLPTYPETGPSIVGRGWGLGAGGWGLGSGLGSNSFALAGSRTATKRPLLANDPHLPFLLPSFWYQVFLEGGGHRVAGGTMPGIPAVIVGTNGFVAWGMTNAMVDDADFYVETIREPDLYQFRGEERLMKVVEETIRVRGETKPRVFKIRYVEHGGVDCPLISDLFGGEPLSLRWVGFEPNRTLEALLRMNRAKDLDGFREALEGFAVPAQNVVYADHEGHIAYFLAGWVPRRAQPGDGLIPMEGSSGEHEWLGYLPFEALPKVIDPEEGFIVTANERIAPDFPGHLFEPPYRSARIRQLLQEKPQYDLQDLQAIQLDIRSLQAEALIEGLIRPYLHEFRGETKEAAEGLLHWDREQRAGSVEASLFHTFYIKLLENAFQEKLNSRASGLYEWYFSIFHLAVGAADQILIRHDPLFMGDRPVEFIEKALQEAFTFLEGKLGRDPSKWGWGRLHSVTLQHPLARRRDLFSRLLNWLFDFNRGPYPCPGDGMTPNASAFLLSQPFEATIGPGYRQVIDLEDPNRSVWIIAGGASGDPRSPHYADQVPLWLEGRSLPMRFLSLEEAMKKGSTLILHPSREL